MKYKSGYEENVDTSGKVLDSSDFGFNSFDYFSIFTDSNITLEIYQGAYGSTIRISANNGFSRAIYGTKLRIKAVTGTANITWYVDSTKV